MSVPTILGLDGVRPVVEIGVGASYSDAANARWDVSLWDTDTARWAGDEPLWLDVTCHVMDVQTDAGRERSTDDWDVGTASIVCENRDGWADYPLSIPDLLEGETLLTIRPGRSIRVRVQPDPDALPVTLWAGYIDAANPSYEAGVGATMTFECIDALGDAGRVDVAKLAAVAGAGENGTARITRVLNAAGWPSYRRDLAVSNVALRATELGAKTIDLLNRAAESVGGQVYGDLGTDTRDPSIALRGRDWAAWDHDDPIAGTIGNYGFGGGAPTPVLVTLDEDPDGSGLYSPTPVELIEDPSGTGLYAVAAPYAIDEDPPDSLLYSVVELVPAPPADTCPNMWELEFDRAGITTRALLGRQGEVEHVYDDATGITLFGVETFRRSDLEPDLDSDLDWLGARILATRSWQYMPRVAAVTVTAKRDHPETVETLCAASPYDPARFRCQHREGNRVVFNRIMMVTGVQHSISPEQWQGRIALDDATPYLVGGTQPAHWDEVDVALWDVATWAAPI